MDGAVFPPCCLTRDQTMVEVMKTMATSFKRSQACTAILSAPNPAAGPLMTHNSTGDSCILTGKFGPVNLLWGHCSFLPGPSMHKVLFVPSQSLFPQSCVSSSSSMVELMMTSKRAYATPRSAVPRAPAAGHCWPIPPCLPLSVWHSNTQRHVWLNLCGVSWFVQSFVWALQASLVGVGFDYKCDFAPPTILLGLFLCPWMWCIFFCWDPTVSCWWLFSSEL